MSVRKNEEKGIFLFFLNPLGILKNYPVRNFALARTLIRCQTMKFVLIQFFTCVNVVLHATLVYFPLHPNPIVFFSVFKAMESDCLSYTLQISFVFDRAMKFTLPRWRNGERFPSIDIYVHVILCQLFF